MKKLVSLILCILFSCQNVLASQLYFVQNPSKSTVTEIIENAYTSKSFVISKRNPYYGTSKKNTSNYAIVLLQDDVSGIYYYFDGDEKINNAILKGFKKKNLNYTEITTRLKDSFDNIASEQIFGKKTSYDFENDKPVINTSYQESVFIPQTTVNQEYQRKNYQTPQTNNNNNVLYGHVGKLSAGTEIPAYLQNALNTQSAKTGEIVTLILSKDLLYNNSVVAPQGSIITGKITRAKSATYAHRNGQISINFDTLQLPSGKIYNISTEAVDFKVDSSENGSSNVAGKMVAGAVTTALVTLMFAALSGSHNIGRNTAIGAGVGLAGVAIAEGAKKGVDAEIPAYTEINLILTQPLSVTMN